MDVVDGRVRLTGLRAASVYQVKIIIVIKIIKAIIIIDDNYSGDDSHREQFWAEHSSEYLHVCHQGRRSDISSDCVMLSN